LAVRSISEEHSLDRSNGFGEIVLSEREFRVSPNFAAKSAIREVRHNAMCIATTEYCAAICTVSGGVISDPDDLNIVTLG